LASYRPRLNDGVMIKDMGEVAIILARDQPPYLANETCKLILSLLDGTNTVASIVGQIVRIYDVTQEQASEDVESTLRSLVELGVVILA